MSTGIEARNVGVSYSNVKALDDVSMRLEAGRVVGLIGPNGAGKSTLLGVLAGTVRARSGSVIYRGRAINKIPQWRRVREGIACSFQEVSCFGGLSVEAAMRIAYRGSSRDAAISDALQVCGLSDLRGEVSGSLTYGQQKLLSIAIALVARPEVLLLDEPAAGVSGGELVAIARTVRTVRDANLCVCLVDHNVEFIMGLSDEVCALDAGQLIAYGSPEDVQSDPAVIECYLGVPNPHKAADERTPR